jgi:hypothetical protein
VIFWLDILRAKVLGTTLRVPIFRRVFFNRPERLLAFFIMAAAFNLLVAEKWPLWGLLLGPLILGIPHLGSTIRYVPRLITAGGKHIPKKLHILLALLLVGVGVVRITFGVESNRLELGLGIACIGILGWGLEVGGARIAAGLATFGLLAGACVAWPIQSVGALVLGHNFVAFGYWTLRAKTPGDRRTAFISLFIFSAISAAILLGVLDPLAAHRAHGILNSAFDELTLGGGIFPDASPLMWSRIASAYAFGQGIHYFVWLKAIPELELKHEHPASFAQTFRLLRRELGFAMPLLLGLVSIALAVVCGILTLPQARDIYLAGAAFHGYLEIAGLTLVRTAA